MKIKERLQKYIMLLVLMLAVMTAGTLTVSAASRDMISEAKANKVKSGKLIKKGKKIRLKKKNGTYVADQWVYFQGNVYSFKKNGCARRGMFVYEDAVYYADKKGVVYHHRWLVKGKKSYYFQKDGTRAQNVTLKLEGVTYKFSEKGVSNKHAPSRFGLKYLFVGDSRTVGMGMSVSSHESAFVGQISMGYSWLTSSAGPQVRSYLRSHPELNVIFAFGINDLSNCSSYISYYKKMVKAYPKANFYFMSVNPVKWHSYISNSQIRSFNRSLKKAFGKKFINTYAYLSKHGYSTFDGVHYTASTYQKIYSYVIGKIK